MASLMQARSASSAERGAAARRVGKKVLPSDFCQGSSLAGATDVGIIRPSRPQPTGPGAPRMSNSGAQLGLEPGPLPKIADRHDMLPTRPRVTTVGDFRFQA